MEASRKVGSEQEWGPVHLAQVSPTRLLELPYREGVPWGLAVEPSMRCYPGSIDKQSLAAEWRGGWRGGEAG